MHDWHACCLCTRDMAQTRLQRRRRRLGWSRLILLTLPLGLGLPAGCASSHSAVAVRSGWMPPSPAVVYSADSLTRWERQYASGQPEDARNDRVISLRTNEAIRATGQWPEPVRPIERPVIFENFEQ